MATMTDAVTGASDNLKCELLQSNHNQKPFLLL